MPGPASRNLKQDITYWAPGTMNTFKERTYDIPVLLKGRWTDKTELVRLPSGEEVTIQSVVFVSEPVEAGGFLAVGDWRSEEDPRVVEATKGEVQAFQTTSDLRFMSTELRAYL